MTRHPEIPRAAIAIAIWATAIVAWWVFDTPIQRHVERQVGPDILVHTGLVVTALTFIVLTFATVAVLRKAFATLRKQTARRSAPE